MRYAWYLHFLMLIIATNCVYGIPFNAIQLQKDYKRALTDDGWFIGANGKQYHLSRIADGFYESGDNCQGIGSDLVTISNVKDQEAVNAFISANNPKDRQFYWIGLHEGTGSSSTSWIWEKTNVLATNFLNWAPEQPASNNALKDCGAVAADGTWYSRNCDIKLFGICEKQGPLIMPVNVASKVSENGAASVSQSLAAGSANGNTGKKPDESNKVKTESDKMKAEYTNGEKCNLINFINHMGKPIRISRVVNDGQTKDYIVEGENYKLNTVFRKVENPVKMEPVVYTAHELQPDNTLLALDGKDSLTLMPGDCDGDFVDVIVSPRSTEEDAAVAKQRSGLEHGQKSRHDKPSLRLQPETQSEEVSKPPCQVETFGGSYDDGSCCRFPFKFNNKLYHDCTKSSKHHLWCATTRDFDTDKKWGYCCLQGECTK